MGLFYDIVTPGCYKDSTVFRFRSHLNSDSRARIPNGEKEISATILYQSRAGKLKFFDLEKSLVFSEASQEEWVTRSGILQLPLFDYFEPPQSRFLRLGGQEFIAEGLLSASDLKSLPSEERGRVLEKLNEQYERYVLNEAARPKSHEFLLEAFDEVFAKLPPAGQLELESYRDSYFSLIQRTKCVETHLDFNIANLLFDGSFFILDNDDAGFVLPAFYDVVNIACNQIWYWKDTDWFELLLSNEVSPSFISLCESCVDGFHKREVALVFLVHFCLLNSGPVRKKLGLPSRTSQQVSADFQQLRQLVSSLNEKLEK